MAGSDDITGPPAAAITLQQDYPGTLTDGVSNSSGGGLATATGDQAISISHTWR